MRKNNSGFTLIELLVVIAIIGILAAILLPALSGIQNTTRRVTVRSTINTLGQALKMYQTDHGVFPPDANEGRTSDNSANFQSTKGLADVSVIPSATSPGTNYVDGALVRYLDGDINNDFASPPANAKPPLQYFEFTEESTEDGVDNLHPVFLDTFGEKFFYNELESQNLAGKIIPATEPARSDPRSRFEMFRTYQIFSIASSPENPAKWITNFRDP